jgi:hypothetical protein
MSLNSKHLETHHADDRSQASTEQSDVILALAIREAAKEYRASAAPIQKRNKRAFAEAMERLEKYENRRFRYMNMTGEDIRAEREEEGDIELPREPSDKTKQIRAAIRRKFPGEFNAGARAGFLATTGYPEQFFSIWTEAQRDAWFAGWSVGGADRIGALMREAAE